MSKTLKVFILEDSSDRVRKFQTEFAKWGKPHDISQTHSVGIAKIHLDRTAYDLVLLDCDLDISHYGGESSDVPNGLDFVKWLIANPDIATRNTHYIVHSLNETNRPEMRRLLTEAGCSAEEFPFLWDEHHLWKIHGKLNDTLEAKESCRS
jgi:CheY-like chemotaxis protein